MNEIPDHIVDESELVFPMDGHEWIRKCCPNPPLVMTYDHSCHDHCKNCQYVRWKIIDRERSIFDACRLWMYYTGRLEIFG